MGTTGNERFDTSAAATELERVWQSIRVHHKDLPRAVIVIASGVELTHVARWGHWAAGRWQVEDGAHVGEVLLAGERFESGAVDVLSTLLHEAAHALAFVRDIKDTSRQGRYHNKRYKALAESVGLVCTQGNHGWHVTELAAGTQLLYSDELAALASICGLGHRRDLRRRATPKTGDDEEEDPEEKAKAGRVSVACDCGRKFRISASVLELGPIVCAVCETPFATPGGAS